MVRSHSVASGDFIIEYGMYVGEVFNQQEFRRRASKFDKNKHYYFMALSGGEIVGATARTEATLRASPKNCNHMWLRPGRRNAKGKRGVSYMDFAS